MIVVDHQHEECNDLIENIKHTKQKSKYNILPLYVDIPSNGILGGS